MSKNNTFRNWPEIAKIKNRFLMMALATIQTIGDEFQLLRQTFPQCFSANPTPGPIPLSVLRAEALKDHFAEGGEGPECEHLATHETPHRLGIPIIVYGFTEQTIREYKFLPPPDPAMRNLNVLDEFDMNGAKFVVLDWLDRDELYVIPAECIDLTR